VLKAMVEVGGSKKKLGQSTQYQVFSPTTSIFPHTTLAHVKIPIKVFQNPQSRQNPTQANFYDTPGVEGDSAYLNSFIDDAYQKAISLYKVGGFQRVPDSLAQGTPLSPSPARCLVHFSVFVIGVWCLGLCWLVLTCRTVMGVGRDDKD
jgi:hypothetical protein